MATAFRIARFREPTSGGGVLYARQRPQRKSAYSERPDDYMHNMDRLKQKYETAAQVCSCSRMSSTRRRENRFLAFGTTHWAIIECRIN